jgi:hypothetical protein
VRFPNSFTRTRTALHPRALDGWFRYQVGSETREVNVLSLAAANGQIASAIRRSCRCCRRSSVDDRRQAWSTRRATRC